MFIGDITIRDKTKNGYTVKISSKTTESIFIVKPNMSIIALCDPSVNDDISTIPTVVRMAFDEFESNIEERDGKFYFIDDLMYICGISIV